MALELLDADLSSMSPFNDGVLVPEAHARQWAALLQAALERRELNAASPAPPGNPDFPVGFALAPAGVPLGRVKTKWVMDFVNFLNASGGFEQW